MPDLDSAQCSKPPLLDHAELDQLRAEHAVVVRALQEAIRDTTRLTRLFAVLNEAAPLDSLLDRVLSTLSELFLADIVVLLDATNDNGLVPLAAIGLPIGVTHQTIPITDSGYAFAALVGGVPVLVAQAQADPKVDPTLRELDVETAVWLPVAGDEGTRRGVLILARCRPLPFAQADVDLLVAMAYRVGLLVERSHADQVRRVLETRLRQAEKTESLGRMAAAVAHHFNNTLAVVVGSLDVALEDLPVGHFSREDLIRAREATLRAAKTSELMLAYIGQSTGECEAVDLVQALHQILQDLKSSIPLQVRLTVELCDPGLTISASLPQIAQLVGNLVVNAAEALGTKTGDVNVSVRPVSAAEIPKSQLPSADFTPMAMTYACLEVSDNGCGMAAETIEKIFDPFFTTKFVGRGLGLPVVLGTVRAHDGLVTVESALERGTTFRVFLPLVTPTPPAMGAPAVAPVVRPESSALVLVAEDEDTLRRTTKRILSRLGYEVITAVDGVEATEKFCQRSNDVRLVILDLAMPRKDGWAALRDIRALRPDIPVILATGYDEMRALEGRPVYHNLLFLHKPYTLVQLRAAAERLMASNEARATLPPR